MEVEKAIKDLKSLLTEKVRGILSEFEKNKTSSKKDKFLELCFCILVANSSMEKTFKSGKKLGKISLD